MSSELNPDSEGQDGWTPFWCVPRVTSQLSYSQPDPGPRTCFRGTEAAEDSEEPCAPQVHTDTRTQVKRNRHTFIQQAAGARAGSQPSHL
jgi:hypothetical protein